MRVPGRSPGIQSFLAGTTDYSKIGNSAQINTAKEHAQSFDNNRQAAGAGMEGMMDTLNADREADAIKAIGAANTQAQMAQGAASMVGSVASVFGSSGGGGGAASAATGGGSSTPISRIDFGSAWSSGVG